MSNKVNDNVIMRVYQPTIPFSDKRIPKKLVSGLINDITPPAHAVCRKKRYPTPKNA